MAEFKYVARDPQFRPRAVVDTASRVREQANKQLAQLREAIQYSQRQDQQRIEDAKFAGQEWSALAPLIKSGVEAVQNIAEQSAKDTETGIIYQELLGNPTDQERARAVESQYDAASATEADAIARDAAAFENKTQDTVGADEARKRWTQQSLARGYAEQQGDLLAAQGAYSPFMASYLAGDSPLKGTNMTVAQAYRSGDMDLVVRAVQQGQFNFFQTFRGGALLRATKDSVVKTLKGIIPNVNNALATTTLQSSIKQQRLDDQAEVEGYSYNLGRKGLLGKPQEGFDRLVEKAWVSGAYLSKGAASKAVLMNLVNGYEDAGNAEGIRALEGVFKKKDENGQYQKGTELGNQFGDMLNDAAERAEAKAEARDNDNAKALTDTMYLRLRQAQTKEQRTAIVNETADQLEEIGQYKKARELRRQQEALSIDGASAANAAVLSQQIKDGELKSVAALDQAKSSGLIDETQYNDLTKELNQQYSLAPPKEKAAADVVDDVADKFDVSFPQAVGLKRDALGNLPDPLLGQYTVISKDAALMIMGAARRDMNRVANAWLRANAGLPEGEKVAKLAQYMDAWYTNNMKTPGGKYYIQDLIDYRAKGRTLDKLDPAIAARVQGLANSPVFLGANNSTYFNRQPVDFSTKFDSASGLSDADKAAFNPLRGDKLFTAAEIEEMSKAYDKDGTLDPRLSVGATQLKQIASPLSLLQQQRAAYSMNPLIPKVNPASIPNKLGTRMTALDGAKYLMSIGFTPKGAAYLAGNIQQESGWYGERPSWDDGGKPAGGLISWRSGRLKALETYYNRPVQQITHLEQLQYMVLEMRTKYPTAYRTFTSNGWASKRQLEEASYTYWGWGDEGKRFTYAENILKQL